MGYLINKTDGAVLISNLQDGTTDTSIGLTLIGRNYPNYGDAQNENFVRLLENFADDIPPTMSVGPSTMVGTLWYDSANSFLKVYDGTNWNPVSQQIVANSAPIAKNIGDQWYNATTQQLNIWTGTQWLLVGPMASSSQGKTGVYVEAVYDTAVNTHIVVNTYKNGNIVSVTSNDAEFSTTSNLYTNFTSIRPGINIPANTVFNGNSTNAVLVGNINPTSFARVDATSSFTKDVLVNGNIVLTNANVGYTSNNAFSLHNRALNGNIDLLVTSLAGTTTALHIDGQNGTVILANDPVKTMGAATKNYVDTTVATVNESIDNVYNELDAALAAAVNDNNANISVIVNQINSNIVANVNSINANAAAFSVQTDQNFANVNAKLDTAVASQNANLFLATTLLYSALASNVNAINGNVDALSTQTSANFASVNITTANLQSQITHVVNSVIPTLAPLVSPVLTGTPTSPTPSSSSNDGSIATTAFVRTAIQAQKFNYTVSNLAPSGGNNGDFWFQIG